jgi:hypothetical protein
MGKQNKRGKGYRGGSPRNPVLPISDVLSQSLIASFLEGTSGAGRLSATEKQLPENPVHTGFQVTKDTANISAVARVDFVPSIGSLATPAQRSALATAMFRYYTRIRSANASISSYSAIDVFKVIFAMSQVFMLMARLRQQIRVYDTKGSMINYLLPEAIARALDVPLDLTAVDIANLKSDYNNLVNRLKPFFVPADFKLGVRHASLVATIFLDDPVVTKSQAYVFCPSYYYKLVVDPNDPNVGQLVADSLDDLEPSDLVSLINDLITSYSLDADISNIYAEMRKAGLFEGNCLEASFYPMDEAGEPLKAEFHQVVLDGLKNASLHVVDQETLTLQESVADGMLHYTSQMGGREGIMCAKASKIHGVQLSASNVNAVLAAEPIISDDETYIYAHDDQPDEVNMGTLLMWKHFIYTINTPAPTDGLYGQLFNNEFIISTHGTEILERIKLISNEAIETEYEPVITSLTVDTLYDTQITSRVSYWKRATLLRMIGNFSNLPVVQLLCIHGIGSNVDIESFHLEGDIDNRFSASVSSIEKLHIATNASCIGSFAVAK